MVEFAIKIIDDSGLRKLQAIHDRGVNLAPFFDRASTILFKDVIDHFKKEIDSKGKWKPLAESTKKWKAKHGWRKPLQNTGRLRGSIIPTPKAASGGVKSAKNKFGSVYYAPLQNFGDKKVPAREFMWASRKAKNTTKEALLDFIIRGKK